MKKALCAVAALVALAPAGAALGQSEPIRLSLGGKLRHFFFVSDQDQTGAERLDAVGMSTDAEIYFNGSTKLDNGLQISATIQLEAESRKDRNADEVYIDFRDTWGRLGIGEKEGFNASFIGSPAPEAFLTSDERVIGEMAIIRRNGITITDAFTFKRFASDVLGVRYQTPEFVGFQAAVSYHPSVSDSEGPVDRATGRNNAVDISAAWRGDLSGIKLRLGGGYIHIDSRKTIPAGTDGLEAWNASVTATAGSFTVGGTVIDVNPSNGTDETSWTVGALFDLDPWSFSVDYFNVVRKPTATAVLKEKTEYVKVQTAYRLSPGIGVGITGFYTDQRTAANETFDGFGMLVGTKIDF